MLIFPTAGPLEPNLTTAAAAAHQDTQGDEDNGGQPESDELPLEVHTSGPEKMQPETPAPQPSRGDGPENKPQVKHGGHLGRYYNKKKRKVNPFFKLELQEIRFPV